MSKNILLALHFASIGLLFLSCLILFFFTREIINWFASFVGLCALAMIGWALMQREERHRYRLAGENWKLYNPLPTILIFSGTYSLLNAFAPHLLWIPVALNFAEAIRLFIRIIILDEKRIL